MPKKIICWILLLNIWLVGETSKDYLKLAITSSEKGFFDLSNKYLEEYIASESDKLDYAYLLYGYNLIKLENYTKAIEKFKIIIEKFPLSPYLKEAYLFIIPAYLKLNDIQGAISYYKQYKKNWDINNELENQICQVLLGNGINLFKNNQYSESLNIFNLILDEFGKNTYFVDWSYYYKGLIEFELNRFSSAREYFLKVSNFAEEKILLDSKLKIGDCYFNEGDYEKAENFYKELLKNKESIFSQWAKFQLSIIEKRKGNYEKSKKFLEDIDYKNDENLEFNVLNEISNIEILLENFENAEKVLKKIIEKFSHRPEISEIYFKLANIYFNKRDFENSVYYFKKVILISQNKILKEKSLFFTGYIYYLQKNFEKAEKIWENLKKEYPDSSFIFQVLFLQGKNFYEKNDFEKAEKIFYSLIENASPYYEESNYFLIETLIKRNKLDQAEKIAKKYLNEKDDKKVKFLLGKIFYLSGKDKQSKEIFESLQIENLLLKAEMNYYLGEIYKRDGDIEKAKEKFIEIITLYPQFKEWKELAEKQLKELKR